MEIIEEGGEETKAVEEVEDVVEAEEVEIEGEGIVVANITGLKGGEDEIVDEVDGVDDEIEIEEEIELMSFLDD